MSQGAWKKAERAARETEGEDEEVHGEIPGWLQENSKSFTQKVLLSSLLYYSIIQIAYNH